MKLARRLFAPVLSLSLLIAPLCAQQPSPAPLPKDPAALMQLAWQQNGLHDPSLHPWHIRAAWATVVNPGGPPGDQGVWEEWWAGDHQYKVTVTAPGFQQTRYVTDRGAFIAGDAKWPAEPLGLVQEMLLMPVPDWALLSSIKLTILKHKEHNVTLICAAPQSRYGQIGPFLPQYCFTGGLADIRILALPGMNVLFNSTALFQGRYVAQSIRIVRPAYRDIAIQVEKLESISPSLAGFTPPPTAVPAPPTMIAVSAGVMNGYRIAGDPPSYPVEAKLQRVQGTVVLRATIATDGRVTNLSVVSGPPLLQSAALDSVRTWRYIPYRLNGEVVAVNTQINLVFTLGGRHPPLD